MRLPSGDPAILLVTYRDVAAVMADPRFSHDLTGPDAPRMTAEPSFLQDPDIVVELLDGDRGLWRRLLDDPGLVPAAVDELLRFTGLSNSTLLRRAVEDVDLPSGPVKAGQTLAIPDNAALRDPGARIWPRPS